MAPNRMGQTRATVSGDSRQLSLPAIAARQRAYAERLRRATAHAAQLRARDEVPSDRYDPDAEIRKRAVAEIHATLAARPPRPALASYRSDSPGAHARRALLRRAADENRRRLIGTAA